MTEGWIAEIEITEENLKAAVDADELMNEEVYEKYLDEIRL